MCLFVKRYRLGLFTTDDYCRGGFEGLLLRVCKPTDTHTEGQFEVGSIQMSACV
jgi:hypothetical protein